MVLRGNPRHSAALKTPIGWRAIDTTCRGFRTFYGSGARARESRMGDLRTWHSSLTLMDEVARRT
jgi:hypothetical protein